MELDGLKRCLAELEEKGVTINSLTTDRHPQVEAEMKRQQKFVHYFDTWHVVKGKYHTIAIYHYYMHVVINVMLCPLWI